MMVIVTTKTSRRVKVLIIDLIDRPLNGLFGVLDQKHQQIKRKCFDRNQH